MEQADHTPRGAVIAWRRVLSIPARPGSGRRLRDLLEDRGPGHATTDLEPTFQETGPDEDGPGHATGPQPAAAQPEAPVDDAVGDTNAGPDDARLRWAEARARYRALVRRAERLADEMRRDPTATTVEIGANHGISGARVSQILAVLRLHPSLLAEILDDGVTTPLPNLTDLVRIARMPNEIAQIAEWRRIVGALERHDPKVRPPRQLGWKHLFAQARTWRADLVEGRHRSVLALAKAERVCHGRVGRVLDLLNLDEALAARLQASKRAPTLRQEVVFAIAKMPKEAQAAAWETAVSHPSAPPPRTRKPKPPRTPARAPAPPSVDQAPTPPPAWARSIRVWSL